jgi:hypothetical protein
MCDYPPAPSLFAALLAAPWPLVVAGAIIGPLGLWLLVLRSQHLAGRARTGLSGVSVTVLIGYSGLALMALVVASSLAWQAALTSWDVSQIDRLEHVGCSIPTLEAVDSLVEQQTSTANSLLGWAAVGTLVAIAFLLVRPTQRLFQRMR